MNTKTPVAVLQRDIERQLNYIDHIAELNRILEAKLGHQPRAYTQTFGCQQNEADTERISGMLHDMGYTPAACAEDADIIVFNTCAVREHAETRALGKIGELYHLKKNNPNLVIGLCGCMVQQDHIPEKIEKSYPQVDILFGTHALWRFPELLYRHLSGEKRVFDTSGKEQGEIAEGLPVQRQTGPRAWLSIMYGCNNFCTYCIVPYVRGRERSRQPQDIIAELKELINMGYKDITLLGQNVNSYGKDLDLDIDFSDLLCQLNVVPGDYVLRFMTSHPKDASKKLIDTMAACDKVANQLHLPFQSGSDRILKAMNRGYTAEKYRELTTYARNKIPDITLSSDIIIGFPGETEEDFCQTLDLVQEVEFDVLFTFLYSKRSGTPAASFEDATPKSEKQQRFDRLLKAHEARVLLLQERYLGKRLRVLVDGMGRNLEYPFTARTEGGLLVCCAGDSLEVGNFAWVTVDRTALRCLYARDASK